MINILITGANGQLGSEIRKIATQFPNFSFTYTDVNELDLTDRNAVVSFCSNAKYDYIVNCAAYTAVDKAESDKELASKINIDAVKTLVEAATIAQSVFIHVSTDYVFSGEHHLPYKEDDKISPRSVYGQTKADGEQEALKYSKSVIIRTAWLYSSFGGNFVKTILRLAKERSELRVVFDQIGSPTYAGDLAQTILAIIYFQSKNGINPGIYHFSNEGVCSWYDFAKEIVDQSGLSCKIMPIESKDYPTPAKRPHYSVFNKSKIKSTFDIEIPHWKDSLIKCLNELN